MRKMFTKCSFIKLTNLFLKHGKVIQKNYYIAVDVSRHVCRRYEKAKMNENVLKHFAGIKKLNIFSLFAAELKGKIFCWQTRRDGARNAVIIGAVNLLQIFFLKILIFCVCTRLSFSEMISHTLQ